LYNQANFISFAKASFFEILFESIEPSKWIRAKDVFPVNAENIEFTVLLLETNNSRFLNLFTPA